MDSCCRLNVHSRVCVCPASLDGPWMSVGLWAPDRSKAEAAVATAAREAAKANADVDADAASAVIADAAAMAEAARLAVEAEAAAAVDAAAVAAASIKMFHRPVFACSLRRVPAAVCVAQTAFGRVVECGRVKCA
jgi:hypothetical protein